MLTPHLLTDGLKSLGLHADGAECREHHTHFAGEHVAGEPHKCQEHEGAAGEHDERTADLDVRWSDDHVLPDGSYLICLEADES